MSDKQGLLERGVTNTGVFVAKVGAVGLGAWLATQGVGRLDIPHIDPQDAMALTQAAAIGLGGTWLLKVQGRAKAAGVAALLATTALVGDFGSELAERQLAPGDRGSISTQPAVDAAKGLLDRLAS